MSKTQPQTNRVVNVKFICDPCGSSSKSSATFEVPEAITMKYGEQDTIQWNLTAVDSAGNPIDATFAGSGVVFDSPPLPPGTEF